MIPQERQKPGERPIAAPTWLRRLAELVILALVVVLHLALLRHAGPAAVDEPNWVTSGYLTYQLYASGAPAERWQAAYDEAGLGDWGNLNPPLGKLWIGLFVAPAVPPGEPVLYRWRWPLGYRENLALGNLPPPRLLEPARRAIAATSIVLLVATSLLSRALGSAWWAALFVPLVLLSVPSYEAHAMHVYVDLPQLALAGLGLGALIRGVTRRRGIRWIALGAVLLGASCAVKLSSGVFVAGGLVALLICPGWSWRRRVAGATLAGALTVALFVGVNPYLHADPVGRLRGIVAGWQARKLQQASDPLLARGRVSGPLDGLRLVARHAVLLPGLSDLAGRGPSRRFRGAASALLLVTLLAGRESWRRARTGACFSSRERTAIIATFGAILIAWTLEAAPPSSVGAFAVPAVAGLAALAASTHDAACRSWLAIWATSLVITGLWLPFDWEVYTFPVRLTTIPIWSLGLTAMARLSLRPASPERTGAATPIDERGWSAVLAALVVILQLVEAASKI